MTGLRLSLCFSAVCMCVLASAVLHCGVCEIDVGQLQVYSMGVCEINKKQ